MSLSKVIKSEKFAERSVTAFRFDSFQTRSAQGFQGAAEGFKPFCPVGDPFPAKNDASATLADEPVDEAFDAGEGMMVISEEELDSRLAEAYGKGGEEERRVADEEFSGIISALAEAISLVSRLRERIIKESEDELLKLAFLVAKKIIRQEIKQDRQIMAQMVNETLREFPEQHDIVICLNPEDCRVISANRELYLAGVGNDRQITFKSDDAMTVGGCVVESSTGIIDARIEAQLDEIYRSLIEERGMLCDMSDTSAPSPRQDKELLP